MARLKTYLSFTALRVCAKSSALALLCTLAIVSPASAQTRPATQPASRPWREDPNRVYTINEMLTRFELDQRLSLCHVWERPDGTLAGFVEQPQYKAALERATKKDVSKIKLLPEESKTQNRFGIVKVDHVILREEPVDEPGDRDNVSELLLSEPVWILDRSDSGNLLVQAIDGYLGWVNEECIQTVGGPAMVHALNRMVAESAKRKSDSALESARQLLGTPYLWGGKTKAGIDCSGLVQVSFADQGILLPRDADQQANVGKLVATRWFRDALMPGDLLFFISNYRGNVHHVAVYLGEGKYIEAADGGVRIRSMKPGDADYDAERADTFAWARRVIQ